MSRPTTLATNGMVASPHYLASAAGLRVLERGGSAMDAAIAANAVLTVVYPDQTAIGGDCFFIAYDAASGKTFAYNGSGPASNHADPDGLRGQGYTAMPAKGGPTVTVPGTIDAWFAGHDRFGKLEMSELLSSAISLARDGFPVSSRLAAVFQRDVDLINSWPGLAAIFFAGGTIPAAGDRLRLTALAASLQKIATNGRDVFYGGHIADEISRSVQAAGGWIATDDLAGYKGEWVDPVRTTYRGVDVLTIPPNSQGVTVQIALKLIEGIDLRSLTWGSADHIHPLVEARKRAYAVRDAKFGDPRFIDIDLGTLLSDSAIANLWADYNPELAAAGPYTIAGDTVYLCAVDRDGNAVSLIQSLFSNFGSAVVAGDTGIILQNRGSFFSLVEGSPNELLPGKRTLHTLMPNMLMKDDRLFGPIGTQGGDPQAQINLQLMTNVIDFGMEPQVAIESPRWISGGPGGTLPYQLLLESGFPDSTPALLGARGHEITLIGPWNPDAGHAQMILVDEARGVLQGGADPRADGTADGY
ncbi:MAG TPA: gamma-glutamyltransferase [Thermomicrobiales bacterium]|nr:gamma-glutamyltransferase [Thermomicrobiales bacterium]